MIFSLPRLEVLKRMHQLTLKPINWHMSDAECARPNLKLPNNHSRASHPMNCQNTPNDGSRNPRRSKTESAAEGERQVHAATLI